MKKHLEVAKTLEMDAALVHLLTALLALTALTRGAAAQRRPDDACEVIRVEECDSVGYTNTTLVNGNRFGHRTQDEVRNSAIFKEYASLMETETQSKCSIDFKLFVCGMFFPRCIKGRSMIPCKSTCIRVRDRCRRYVKSPWPTEMNCDQPYFSDKYDSCMLSSGNPDNDNPLMVMDIPDEDDESDRQTEVQFANCQCTCTHRPPPPCDP